MAFPRQDEILLRVLRSLSVQDGAVASAISVAFRNLVVRSPQLAAVRLITPEEMRQEMRQEEDLEDFDDLESVNFYTNLGHKGAAEIDGVHVLKASICLAGYRSEARMTLLERGRGLHYNFHEACDAESADLQLVVLFQQQDFGATVLRKLLKESKLRGKCRNMERGRGDP